jgi:hypothetical protein
MILAGSRAKCQAGGGPLERRVRQRHGEQRHSGSGTKELSSSILLAVSRKLKNSCACTAMARRCRATRAQAPLTDFQDSFASGGERRTCNDHLHSSASSSRALAESRRALRGVLPPDFHERLARRTLMVQASGALRLPNVRGNLTVEAGGVSPDGHDAISQHGRAYDACRSGSG